MKRKALALGAVGVAAVLLALGVGLLSDEENKPTVQAEESMGHQISKTFSLKDLNGNTVVVGGADSNGKIQVINFWATWCPPCRAEIPELQEFYQAHREDIAFHAVNLGETGKEVKEFLTAEGYQLPVVLDSDEQAAAAYQVRAIPTTFIVDAKGEIRFHKLGGVTRAELEQAIQDLRKSS